MVKVYYDARRRRWIFREGRSNTTRSLWSGFTRAHEVISRSLMDSFMFFLVFSQPDIGEKTRALIKVLEMFPSLRKRIGVLVSYALIDDETLSSVRMLKEQGVQVMLDSGAFHVLERRVPLEHYLSWIDKYVDFVNRWIYLFDWAVIPDVPCDSRPCESIRKLSNRWKIETTIRNAVYMIDRVVDPRKIMIVVQGYEPEEYAYSCQLYKQYGIITARVGVGSLCIRKYSRNAVREVETILETVRQHLPGWVRLHAFGLNIRFLKHEEIRRLLSSSDSDAWVYSYSRYGRLVLYSCKGTLIEIDLKDITRRFKIRNIDRETIYFYAIMSYIMKLGTLKEGAQRQDSARVAS